MNDIKISVIVPVYNVELYLRRCLDSLVNQTLKDIEIICINDCSPDNSIVILEEYAKKDERLKIINLEKNRGVSAARNIGIKQARGEYVGFCDSDDYVDLEFFEKLYENNDNGKLDIIIGGVKVKYLNRKNEITFPMFERISKNRFAHQCFCEAIYKRSHLKNNQIEFSPFVISEDWLFCCKAIFFAKKIKVIDGIFYHYIFRENSATTTTFTKNTLKRDACKHIFKFINKENISKKDYLCIFNITFEWYCGHFYKTKDVNIRKFIIKNIFKFYCECKYKESVKFKLGLIKLRTGDIKGLFLEMSKYYEFGYKLIPQIPDSIKLYSWGTGNDAFIILKQCKEKNQKITAFLDSNPNIKKFQGYKVLRPEYLLNSANKNFFILINSRAYANEIAKICKQAGLKEGLDFWKPG
jgi:glycosyltransferase involved in cell wall biosynthesis